MADHVIYEARQQVRVERVAVVPTVALEASDVLILYRRNGTGDTFQEEWGRISEAVAAYKAKEFPLGGAPVSTVAGDARVGDGRRLLKKGDVLTIDVTDNDSTAALLFTAAVRVSEVT